MHHFLCHYKFSPAVNILIDTGFKLILLYKKKKKKKCILLSFNMALKNNNRKTDLYYFIRCPGVLYLRLRISIQTEQQEDELTGLARKKKQTKQNQNMLNLLPSFINCVLLGVARGERARQTQS